MYNVKCKMYNEKSGLNGLLCQSPVFVVNVLLALVLAFFAPWSETSALCGTLCRELLAGTNEGRQALLGSALEGPLGALVVLPWSWLFSGAIAVRLGAATGWFLALVAGLRSIESPQSSLTRYAFALLLAAAAFTSGAGANPQAAVFAACGLYVFRCGANWCQLHRMRDIIGTAAGLAGLALCGFAGWCAIGVTFWFLPLGVSLSSFQQSAISNQQSRCRRLPAILLLSLLPLLYAFGVWMLMNRLVFGDSLFFLRPLTQATLCNLPRIPFSQLLLTPQGLAGLFAIYTLVASVFMRNVPFIVSSLLLLLTCCAGLWLNHLGLTWITPGLTAATLLAAAWLVRSVRGVMSGGALLYPLVGYIVLFFFIGVTTPQPGYPRAENRERLNAILDDIESRTPHGRLFVCGYAGLALLDASPDSPKVCPNLDLHISQLRKDYHGQRLFFLLPAPVGRGAADAVWRTHATPGALSRERALLIAPGSDWNLYEVIGAPTQEQFDAWQTP